MNKKKIVIGARGSKLATKYAERAIKEIKKYYSGKIELKKIITKGDKILNRRTSDWWQRRVRKKHRKRINFKKN